MIKKFVENLEKTIASSSVVLSSSIQKHFGPNVKTAYVKGQIIFMNSSILEIAICVTEFNNTLSIDKHRLHYMDNHGQMLFRYDNVPRIIMSYLRILTINTHRKKQFKQQCLP
ncbi:MAG: hypothetical protein FJ266_06015 [Planctomycetes bacterium]|nr:hypothetical protein [Planctomycetota bacterium]